KELGEKKGFAFWQSDPASFPAGKAPTNDALSDFATIRVRVDARWPHGHVFLHMTGDGDVWDLAEKAGAGKEYLSGKENADGSRSPAIPDQQLALVQKPCAVDGGWHIGNCQSANGAVEVPQLGVGTYEF